jgi:hypothetical protein
VVDLRTDGFADFGKMYGTTPGFYLLVGPDWNGDVPAGITKVFRAGSNTGVLIPRVYQDDTPQDKRSVQAVLSGVNAYALSEYTGRMRSVDWAKQPRFPAQAGGDTETKWVVPEKFWDTLGAILVDVKPRPGEGALYDRARALIAAAAGESRVKTVLVNAAADVDKQVVQPLFEFRNYGLQLPANWSSVSNGAQFGSDYFTRTAAAKSNINETKYFYQDLDAAGARLNGAGKYTVTSQRARCRRCGASGC